MGEPHKDKILHDFKLVIKHQMVLLRKACNAETAYFYWINRSRKQFVLESRSTKYTQVMFQDRVPFEQHFLNPHKDISEIKRIEVGPEKQLDPAELIHYSKTPSIAQLTLVPLKNNEETVAITVLEHEQKQDEATLFSTLESYILGLENMMETYMEINQLNQGEKQWELYENELSKFQSQYRNATTVDLLAELTGRISTHLSDGGVVIMGKEGDEWISMWNITTQNIENRIVPGLRMEEGSISSECVQNREVVYLSHLNGSPKRISSREPEHHGATLAVPLIIHNRLQAMVLIYDQNPLVFKESVKHKLINLIRIACQMMTINWTQSNKRDPLRTDQLPVFRKEVWQYMVRQYLGDESQVDRQLGIGRLSIDNLQELRTKLRLEQLNEVCSQMLKKSRPVELGLPGFLGQMKDFVFAVNLPITHDETISYYERTLMERISDEFKLKDNETVDVSINLDFKVVSSEDEESELVNTMNSLQ